MRRRRPAAPPACRGSRGAASADVVTVLVAVAAACLRPRAFALPTPGAGASAGRWTRGKRRAREGTEEAGWWVGLGWAKSSPSSGAMRAAGPAGGRMRLRQAAGAPSRAGRDMLPRRPVRSNLGASVRRRPLGRALVCGPLRVLWPVCASRCPASPGALRRLRPPSHASALRCGVRVSVRLAGTIVKRWLRPTAAFLATLSAAVLVASFAGSSVRFSLPLAGCCHLARARAGAIGRAARRHVAGLPGS